MAGPVPVFDVGLDQLGGYGVVHGILLGNNGEAADCDEQRSSPDELTAGRQAHVLLRGVRQAREPDQQAVEPLHIVRRVRNLSAFRK